MNLQKSWRFIWKAKSKADKLTLVLLVIYLIAIVWILLFKLGVRFSYMEHRQVNLIPFKDLILNGKTEYDESIMNVIIFLPLGIYTGTLFKKWNFSTHMLSFLILTLMIESIQFTFKIGAFDITDVVTNTLGGIIGFMTYKAILRAFFKQSKAHNFINLIAAIGSGLMILFLYLLKTNHLGIRYQ